MRAPHTRDTDDIELRLSYLRGASLPVLILAAAFVAAGRHTVIDAVVMGSAAVGLALSTCLVPWRRLLRTRAAEIAVAAWLATLLGLILAATALGDGSPFALALVPACVYAAIVAPLRTVVPLSLLALVVLAVLDTAPALDGVGASPLAIIVVLTAGLAAWQRATTERRHRAIARLGRTDPATGVLNQAAVRERLSGEIAAADRTGRELAVLIVDVAGAADGAEPDDGDRSEDVRRCAQMLRDVLRPSDVLGRTGPTEFTIVATSAGTPQAGRIASRVRRAFDRGDGAAIGSATFPSDGASAEVLLAQARERCHAFDNVLSLVQPAAAPSPPSDPVRRARP